MRISDCKLNDWIKAGLITSDQAQQIRNYEDSNSNKSSWILIGFYVLATLIIGLGVISLIAFNWDQINTTTKLLADLSMLLVLATSALYFNKRNSLAFELLILSMLILCMASIGLIGQIYHLVSPTYVALLLWSVMTFTLLLSSAKAFNWIFWLGCFLSGLYLFCTEELFPSLDVSAIISVSILALLVSVTLLFKRLRDMPGCFYALNFWVVLGFLIAIMSLEVHVYFHEISANLIFIPTIATGLAILSIYNVDKLSRIQKPLASSIMLILLLFTAFSVFQIHFAFLPALGTIAMLLLAAIFLASLHRKILFNSFIVLILARATWLYFEAFGGLATTGAGLIIIGVLILYLTILWGRHGKQLLRRIERWADAAK